MKGVLKYTAAGWIVRYFDSEKSRDIMYCGESLPLHQETFDLTTKQPIIPLVEGKQVDFETVRGVVDLIPYARLIEEYPELEGTLNLCEDIVKKKTGKMTEEEWQAAEYGNRFDLNDISLAFRAGIEHGINPNKPNTTDYLNQLRKK